MAGKREIVKEEEQRIVDRRWRIVDRKLLIG
jgi:hypothetical protein